MISQQLVEIITCSTGASKPVRRRSHTIRIFERRPPLASIVAVAFAIPRLPFGGCEFEIVDQIVLLRFRVLEARDVRFTVLCPRDDHI
jgi:hypothetical protein